MLFKVIRLNWGSVFIGTGKRVQKHNMIVCFYRTYVLVFHILDGRGSAGDGCKKNMTMQENGFDFFCPLAPFLPCYVNFIGWYHDKTYDLCCMNTIQVNALS